MLGLERETVGSKSIARDGSRAEATGSLIAELKTRYGERFSTAEAVRAHHGREETYHKPCPPDAVFFAETTAEVADVVRAANASGVPIIPYGTGTSLEGNIAALHGGITVNVSRMDQILRLSVPDLDVTVQPGVTRRRLNEYLRDTGLFFPIDPGADASLGGMAATRASGTNAVRYGTMRDNVLSLTVVLADGRIIRTASRARKSSAGYDLTRLFVGSEGTLGIITEVTLRLYGIPEAISSAVCGFPDIESAVNTVILTIQSGIPIARIELLDEMSIDAVNRYSKLDLPIQPTLFFEFHGTNASVTEQAEQVGAIAADFGGGDFRWTASAEERTRLWQARHDALYASIAMRPGGKGISTDVCVPISRLADCIMETKADLAESFLSAPLVGHAGDGNFHLCILVDPDLPADMAEAKRLDDRLIRRALDMDGTCTGEHGVGYGKITYVAEEHGEALDVMRAVKRALDPNNILNPGKIFNL